MEQKNRVEKYISRGHSPWSTVVFQLFRRVRTSVVLCRRRRLAVLPERATCVPRAVAVVITAATRSSASLRDRTQTLLRADFPVRRPAHTIRRALGVWMEFYF